MNRCFFCQFDFANHTSAHQHCCATCIQILPLNQHACTKCARPIFKHQHLCGHCSKSLYGFTFKKSISPFIYQPPMNKLMAQVKNPPAWAVNPLCKIGFEYLWNKYLIPSTIEDIYWIPVPTSKKRLIERGFNPSYLISKRLHMQAKQKGLNSQILKRFIYKKHTSKDQKNLNSQQRLANAYSQFGINQPNRQFNSNRLCILVDDVITTGSTLNACAKLLEPYNDNIWAFSLARGEL